MATTARPLQTPARHGEPRPREHAHAAVAAGELIAGHGHWHEPWVSA